MKINIRHAAFFTAALLLTAAIALNRDGHLLGMTPGGRNSGETQTEWTAADGSRLISTEELAKDVLGFGGSVPLHIYMREGHVVRVEALDNYETPPFFAQVARDILPAWNGLTADEALKKEVAAVSGATISSRAVIENFRRGMEYARGTVAARESGLPGPRTLAAFATALCGLLLPFFIKSAKYRFIQLLANTAVLGFWSGSFLSLSLLTNIAANGVKTWSAALALPLIFAAFIMPFLGKKGHYCSWMCPLGSLQELLNRLPVPKINIPASAVKWLEYLREAVWLAMMMLMWLGVGFELMDYELFSAFLFRRAAPLVLALAAVFFALSLVTPRPYCRFLCPTGTLIRFAQGDCTCAAAAPRALKLFLAASFVIAPLWIVAGAFV
ncbi:4Fe-4S binding protein [Cloacibacillus porcorum]|uniref:FMN-binding protein n=1 Tax=Cloacibacillus porcorum TaxID=1197717 RepID=UPI0023F3A8F6|nr:4Fe-4S binding protein [Cloacibacillus porcorum]MDD7649663.1 4Fe-4S binding protein [Cloacibacillus porcorum]MDY4092543.1 4Fe-4S binding protein [Cloacibacillus porcorum]